jgi:hypothetical protein
MASAMGMGMETNPSKAVHAQKMFNEPQFSCTAITAQLDYEQNSLNTHVLGYH